MSGSHENNNWNQTILAQRFAGLETVLGSHSYCLKNCLDVSTGQLSERERTCFSNCRSVYEIFKTSFEKNFPLNNNN